MPRSPSPPGPRPRPRRLLALLALLAFAAAALLYASRAAGPYHFDDFITPVSDPASQSLPRFFSLVFRTLRPLSKLTFAFESSFGLADAPAARRVVSALGHGVATALFFHLGTRLRLRVPTALVLALLYGLSPLHAETVWALAGRGALLAGLLLFASALAIARGRLRGAALLFGLALLSRETALAGLLPLGALAWTTTASRDPRPRVVGRFRRVEGLLTAALLFAGYLLLHRRYGELFTYSMEGRPRLSSLAAQLGAIPVGLSLYLRPGALSFDHGEPLPARVLSWPALTGLALLLLALVGGLLAFARGRRALGFGALLWVAALVPTQTMVPKLDALSERPLGLALAGLLLVIGALVDDLRRRAPRLRLLLLGAGVPAALALALASRSRGALYASDTALVCTAAARSETNARPHYNCALARRDDGDLAAALEEARLAHRLAPFDVEMEALYRSLSGEVP